METPKPELARKKEGLWNRVRQNLRRLLKELEEDSVSSNPRPPVDCCHPPPGAMDKNRNENQES